MSGIENAPTEQQGLPAAPLQQPAGPSGEDAISDEDAEHLSPHQPNARGDEDASAEQQALFSIPGLFGDHEESQGVSPNTTDFIANPPILISTPFKEVYCDLKDVMGFLNPVKSFVKEVDGSERKLKLPEVLTTTNPTSYKKLGTKSLTLSSYREVDHAPLFQYLHDTMTEIILVSAVAGRPTFECLRDFLPSLKRIIIRSPVDIYITALVDCLSAMSNINTVKYDGIFTDNDRLLLTNHLRTHPGLVNLDLPQCSITTPNTVTRKGRGFKGLHTMRCAITHHGAKVHLQDNLRKLSLRMDDTNDKAGLSIFGAIRHQCPSLTSLEIQLAGATIMQIRPWVRLIREIHSLRHLRITHEPSTHTVGQALNFGDGNPMPFDTPGAQLKSLVFGFENKIRPTSLEEFCDKNPQIEVLSFMLCSSLHMALFLHRVKGTYLCDYVWTNWEQSDPLPASKPLWFQLPYDQHFNHVNITDLTKKVDLLSKLQQGKDTAVVARVETYVREKVQSDWIGEGMWATDGD